LGLSQWARNNGLVVGFGELRNEFRVSVKYAEFHDYHSDYHFLGRTLLYGLQDSWR